MRKNKFLAGVMGVSLVLSSFTLSGVPALASQAVGVSLDGSCVITCDVEFTSEEEYVYSWFNSYGAKIDVTKVTMIYGGEEVDISDYGTLDGSDTNYTCYILFGDEESYFEDNSTIDQVTAINYYVTVASTDFDNNWCGGAIGYCCSSYGWTSCGQWTSAEDDTGKQYYLYLDEELSGSGESDIASGECGDDLTWVLSEDGVLTISGTGEMYDYSATYPYATPWYSNCGSIVSVVIEEGVTSIGNNAFAVFYDNLVSVDIPDSLTSIGEYAFYWCDNLTEININDNITEIGAYAFYGCDGLADDNGFVVIRDELICYCGDALEIEIPSNVVTIATDAFVENTITSVVISEGVEEIGDRAFEYARLENVEISNTVTTIGALAFYGCEGLTSVTIPSSVTSIGGSAFGYYLGENGGDKVEGFTIYGYSGTAAEDYAEENGFTFIDLDGTSTAEVTLGDANGDNEINYLDAMAVLRYDAELMEMTDVQLAAADVNDDGSVNSLDAILILRYDAGLIASFVE